VSPQIDPVLYFWLFLKASLFSTGGLGNLPFLHNDLIALGWAGERDFVTGIAVGQVSPGPTGLWSISLGYLTYGWPGGLLALLALTLPTLLVLIVNNVYNRLATRSAVQNFARGLALGVVGLTVAVTWTLARTTITDWQTALIGLAAMGLLLTRRVPAIAVLGAAAVAGCVLYLR
jgi:chromate transporter